MADEGSQTGRRAERAATVAFGACAVAAVALALVYLGGGQPQAEGALLAVALGALGYGLVLWGHHLTPEGPFEEARHSLSTTARERAAFEGDFERQGMMPRRRLLRRALTGALGALGVAALFPIRSLGPNPGSALRRTPWRPGRRLVNEQGSAVRAADVPVGGLVTVFPEGHPRSADGQAVLVRVRPEVLAPPSGRRTWSPGGLLAYSKVCTHAGCAVGLFNVESNQLFCPCHQSAFDVLAAGEVVFGPAARRLPQLPLSIDDEGYLVAQSDFSEPIGPAWWTRPRDPGGLSG